MNIFSLLVNDWIRRPYPVTQDDFIPPTLSRPSAGWLQMDQGGQKVNNKNLTKELLRLFPCWCYGTDESSKAFMKGKVGLETYYCL